MLATPRGQAPPPLKLPNAQGPPGCNLFVVQLPDTWQDQHLATFFSAYGPVLSANICRDSRNGMSKGYGFVSLLHGHKASEAVERLNGILIDGRRIKVELRRQDTIAESSPFAVHTPSPIKYGLFAAAAGHLQMMSPQTSSESSGGDCYFTAYKQEC